MSSAMAEGAQVGGHLAARVAELHPELCALCAANLRPAAEFVELTIVFQHHAAGAGHGAAIDHHVARQQQARAALGPGLVEAQQRWRRGLIGIGHVFFHRGFGDAVGEPDAIGQEQRGKYSHGYLGG